MAEKKEKDPNARLDSVKSRCFMLLLYPGEDPTHNITKITRKAHKFGYEVAYIKHNKDKWEEDGQDHKKGDLKKPHVHMIVRWTKGNQIRRKSLAQYFEINKVYIEPSGNTKAALRYLIHADNPEKHQYKFEAVKGDQRLLQMLYTSIECEEPGLSDEEFWDIVSQFINGADGEVYTDDIVKLSFAYGCGNKALKWKNYIHDMLLEHNYKYKKLAQHSER